MKDMVDFFNDYDREQARQIKWLPVCADCGNPIQDDYYYDINGEIICQACLDSNYRKDVDDWFE